MVRIAFMVRIKALAPTISDALKAVETGCRKVQDDTQFSPMMSTFMSIENDYCFGCLATCALMQLTDKTAQDLIACFSPGGIEVTKSRTDRAQAFGLTDDLADVHFFEYAIDCLRENELFPLLDFYGLDKHEKASHAIEWLQINRKKALRDGATKDDLRKYADFLKNELIPKVEGWFAA
jgi:hypothetical protein